jgi:MinD superfamily P-loop ATPase
MRVAIASGKGGTGKTTVTASLAKVWLRPLIAVDMDVEEPNLHLFLKPELSHSQEALMEVPEADEELCVACGACSEICQFKAISLLGETLLVFPEMCHGCGGCLRVCPSGALSPASRLLGEVLWGRAGEAGFVMGRLRVGEAMSPPLMRVVNRRLQAMLAEQPGDVLIDAPPGVSCPAVSAVSGADLVILVTEPTPFGLFDLRLAHQAFTPLGMPMAVVINRAGLGDDKVQDYCRRTGLPLLAEIPFEKEAASAYAKGQILAEVLPAMNAIFQDLAASLPALARQSLPEASHA